MVTSQIDALNTVRTHFELPEKRSLKRKVGELQIKLIKEQKRACSLAGEVKYRRQVASGIWDQSTDHLLEVSKVLEKGTDTGLTLSPEEVQTLHRHINECYTELEALMDEQ